MASGGENYKSLVKSTEMEEYEEMMTFIDSIVTGELTTTTTIAEFVYEFPYQR